MPRPPVTYASPDLFEVGLGEVAVCRFHDDGLVEAGVFLVDIYCLGVKSANHATFPGEDDFREAVLVDNLEDPLIKSGAWGRKLIEGAVQYARSLGLSPHPDYQKGARVFGDIDADECREVFTYGHQGRPLFVQGPDDDPETCQRILATLRRNLGEDGFDYQLAGTMEPGMVIAMDSGSDGDAPHPELLNFATEFLSRNASRYAGVVQGEDSDTELAASLLQAACDLVENSDDPSRDLKEMIDWIVRVWNVHALPPEEREHLLSGLPEADRQQLEEGVTVNDPLAQEETLIILDHRLVPGNETDPPRLFLIALPWSDFRRDEDELPSVFPSPGR
jgi:hypothetical protein